MPIAFDSDEYNEAPDLSRGQRSLEVLESFVRAGLQPIEIIRAITINGATLLGTDKDVGSLDEGKLADIVAVIGNPLTNPLLTLHIEFAMSGGEVVKNNMMNAAH